MGIPLKGQAQGPAILICLQLSPHPSCLQKSSPEIVSRLWPLSRTRSPVTSSHIFLHGVPPHQWDETSGGKRLLLTPPTCTCPALLCPSSHIPVKSHTFLHKQRSQNVAHTGKDPRNLGFSNRKQLRGLAHNTQEKTGN